MNWIALSTERPKHNDPVVVCNARSTEFWCGVWIDEAEMRANTEALIPGVMVVALGKPPQPFLMTRQEHVPLRYLTHWFKLLKPE